MGMRKKTISAKDYNGPKKLPNSNANGHYVAVKRKKKRT